MEIMASSSAPPFHNRDVCEWSRLDSITGVLQRARYETDHWTASTPTSTATYNKVVDARAHSHVDGSVQQAARRQCEVFQRHVPGAGRVHVVKTQTVASSRWKSGDDDDGNSAPFGDLQLSLNPLDLATEKAKASVGRRGGGGAGRRPPTRAKIRDNLLLHTTASANLHRVSRLCHQIHSSAVQQTFGKTTLLRTKSSSSEELCEKQRQTTSNDDDDEWRRSSKLRRSLPHSLTKQRTEDVETGKRLCTALRGNSAAIDANALDEILKSIDTPDANLIVARKPKRESFVSAATIQAVREKLRRTDDDDDHSGSVNLKLRSKTQAKYDADWFARRKSYGFEQQQQQVRAEHEDTVNASVIKRNESSADNNAVGNVKRYAMLFENRIEQARTNEPKRHSIAVDEFKYIMDEDHKPASEAAKANTKSNKKVEFCKTEVHFAADSGRVNIVATDEKPPPTQRFRRRRRNSGACDAASSVPASEYNGLPLQHFGDSCDEKYLFGDTSMETPNNVTVSCANKSENFYEIEEEPHNESEVRGILKNKASRFLLPPPNSPPVDERTSPWSVAERIKQVEELKWIDNKGYSGYSTKVNFGNGGATTVVENRHTTWPCKEEQKERKTAAPLNTTTTKIRIDLTRRAPPAPQLDDLKRMYIDAHSDSEADKEVDRILMNSSPSSPPPPHEKENGSVRSHSWSKVHTYQQINDQIEKDLHYLNEEVKNLNLQSKAINKSPLNNYHPQLSSPFLVGVQSRSRQNSLSSSDNEKPRDPSPKRFAMQRSVLRQPKQSEMTYFGVKPPTGDKPDLLKFHSSPIYQNWTSGKRDETSTFDSTAILDELTRAADEILLSVHGSDIEDKGQTRKQQLLDTISENRSWQQQSGDKRKTTPKVHSYAAKTTSTELKARKKSTQHSDTTRARRLQRASSREALLLQSAHGSSSEDLPHHDGETITRKPRSVKRTKTASFNVTNGITLRKPRQEVVNNHKLKQHGERNLPEIRHRTVVSTIRSTAEKQAAKQQRGEDAKRKTNVANVSKRLTTGKAQTISIESSSNNKQRSKQAATSKVSARPTSMFHPNHKTTTRSE